MLLFGKADSGGPTIEPEVVRRDQAWAGPDQRLGIALTKDGIASIRPRSVAWLLEPGGHPLRRTVGRDGRLDHAPDEDDGPQVIGTVFRLLVRGLPAMPDGGADGVRTAVGKETEVELRLLVARLPPFDGGEA